MIAQQLITLMYGSIVKEILNTCENMTEANQRLQKIGHRIGSKMVDQFMKDGGKPCTHLAQLVEKFSTVGIKKFLVGAQSRFDDYKLTQKGFSFNIKIANNPLLKNLQLQGQSKNGLQYQSLMRGCFKGVLQVLRFKSEILLIYQSIKGDKNQSIFFVEASRM